MSVAKTIEIIAGSSNGFEDAIKRGIAKAAESVNGIQGAWVKDSKVEVANGKVTDWRVTLAVTFIVE
jgi:flavin-binding protein dodecin